MGSMRKLATEENSVTTTEGAKMSASNMLKEAGCPLAERAKIAAAVVALNEQREVHSIMTNAAEIQKTAALQGVTLDDETCIKAAADVHVEGNMQKRAALEEKFGGIDKEADTQKEAFDWSKIKEIISNPAVRIPGAAVAGGGIGAGGAALAGASPQETALAGLLGGTLGAAGGLSADDLGKLQQFAAAQKAGPLAGAAGKFVGQTAGEAGKAVGEAAGTAGKAVGQGATDLLARIRKMFQVSG
jgi:hypothetical protein